MPLQFVGLIIRQFPISRHHDPFMCNSQFISLRPFSLKQLNLQPAKLRIPSGIAAGAYRNPANWLSASSSP